ncbi:MAG: hypothetical protein B5M53_03595 [Candidatus Cloacimonas sp. 4484_209]|nr:MAG: hypothetical protein B5M53_03595 [Candidatus Cloacimonas sp. 4484_209]
MITGRSPNVSVIIPTYNRAHIVGRAIQSVLDQTYQDFEIVVIDDGSNDNTEEVVKGFTDEKIRYIRIRHGKNNSPSAAINAGIKAARGKYVAFLDSDDEWVKKKLEKQMSVFKEVPSSVGVVYAGLLRIEGDRRIYIPSPRIEPKEGDIHDNLLKGNFVTPPTVIAKKECFTKVGAFDEQLPRLEDWELWIRISKCYHFKYIDEPLVISYHMPDSRSAKRDNLIKAYKMILEKHFKNIQKYRRPLAEHYLYVGHLLCLSGEMQQGRNYFMKAMSIRTYPLNIKFFLPTFISLFGQSTYVKIRKLYRKFEQVIK